MNTLSGLPLADAHGRSVSYLRLSVTDRCNLRCVYCDNQMSNRLSHFDVLRYEEMLDLMGLARGLGIGKVRLTGGEPFARKDFMEFLERARTRYPDLRLRITTNGTMLAPFAPRLAAAGVDRVNISLDTLDPATFARVTGRDLYHAVRRAIDACLEAGLGVKINAVAMRGVNDQELPGFLALARELPVDVRFIEYMPMGGSEWHAEQVWRASDILAEAQALARITLLPRDAGDAGPAQMYAIEGGKGRLGLITPLSNHFCASCNRLRITSGGVLRTCLFSDKVYRLRPALRHPKLGLPAVERILRLALRNKPVGADLLAARRSGQGVSHTAMSSIGG
ncbi:cyclic pyranopterin phosphate synthase [Humidesulfovibrio mexicanus]|uniref:GTP 3',8-cyclase n=1 Tax=Humidesulfovibrio mexicanus TaxID=147047 RepID=A0A239A5X9_9BACT|nr:GTP 3',8-cyclase MoaA [Humidesulfovibrio mexicanus]SNR90711.1 cyclic pyranopterin phosphate synthase [Humidesulfovibrio mexicanus]